MLRNILLGLGLFATLFAVLIFSGKINVGNKKVVATGDVVLWGTIPDTQMNTLISAFNPKAKTYAVRYTYIPETVFKQKLLEGLASGNGPDMIIAPYQTILSQTERIQPYPAASFGETQFKNTFVDGASVFFTPAGALAFPVSIDPMVLFYNRALFSKHGVVNAPESWDEVVSIVPSLTNKNANGTFVESGIALGTPVVSYAKDIIMTMISQMGQKPVVQIYDNRGGLNVQVTANEPVTENSAVRPLTSATRYFTQFGDPGQLTYSWSQFNKNDPSDDFVAEKLAMYIGYSGELATLKARNPRGEFEMTYLPQTKGYNTFSTGMKMYGIATLRASRNPLASFTVQSDFSSAGVAPSIALMTGGAPGLRAYATTPGLDPIIARSMLVARGWFDNHEEQSTIYTASMISDIINYRQGVNDAAATFVARLRDTYSSQ